jgi:hypothetical protein
MVGRTSVKGEGALEQTVKDYYGLMCELLVEEHGMFSQERGRLTVTKKICKWKEPSARKREFGSSSEEPCRRRLGG